MTGQDLFDQITAAVLDLQASTIQTYAHPLRKLGRLLNHEDLTGINQGLEAGLDIEKFLADSANTGGSFVGSQTLLWPDEVQAELGMKLLLVKRLAADPDGAVHLSHDFYYSGKKIIDGIHAMTNQLVIPFVRDYKAHVYSRGNMTPKLLLPKSRRIFIVHGHDVAARETVARFLERIGFEAVILHEQANQGRTIIEKVEANADVGFAVVLLTPDDQGRAMGAEKLESRARQNVLLELGYFIARLGRGNVCTLRKGGVEIPSDFAGVVWTAMDVNGGWQLELAKELKASGYPVDFNKVVG